jgi:hypothetical protein
MMKQKIKEWLKRYLLAEIVGTITAVGAASITHTLCDNLIFTAYIGSLGEAIGFYSTMFIQNLLPVLKKFRIENKTFSFLDLSTIIASIVLEFGVAGILDGFLLRPFFMYVFPLFLKDFTLGLLVGKIAGDCTFYILVILSYEIKKRRNKRLVLK